MKQLKLRNFGICWLALGLLGLICLGNDEVLAAGKKPRICLPQMPGGSTPFPVRKVVLTQIGTKIFQLPNGVPADLDFDMQTILTTSITSDSLFAPTDPGNNDPCNAHLELRSAVSTFQLDVVEAGISFGYNPTGSFGGIASINGEAKVKVGMIAIDLSLWQCKNNNCFAVAASTSNQMVTGGDIIFNVDFGSIKAGSELIINPILSGAIRKIVENAAQQLMASPRIPDLAWTARVRNVNPSTGVLIFDEGDQAHLKPNQTFVIYAPTDNTPQGVCDVFQTIAYIHTTAVNPVSSVALVDELLDPRGVLKDDVVMIRNIPNPTVNEPPKM